MIGPVSMLVAPTLLCLNRWGVVFLSAFGAYALFLLLAGLTPPLLIALHQPDLATEATVFLWQACHQNPTRSFWYWGYPMALCGRCIGIYAGCVLGVVLMLRQRTAPTFWGCLLLMGLGFIDKVMELLPFVSSFALPEPFMVYRDVVGTTIRTALGVVFGVGLAGVLGHCCSALMAIFFPRSTVDHS